MIVLTKLINRNNNWWQQIKSALHFGKKAKTLVKMQDKAELRRK